jgi:hypothetical protein
MPEGLGESWVSPVNACSATYGDPNHLLKMGLANYQTSIEAKKFINQGKKYAEVISNMNTGGSSTTAQSVSIAVV